MADCMELQSPTNFASELSFYEPLIGHQRPRPPAKDGHFLEADAQNLRLFTRALLLLAFFDEHDAKRETSEVARRAAGEVCSY